MCLWSCSYFRYLEVELVPGHNQVETWGIYRTTTCVTESWFLLILTNNHVTWDFVDTRRTTRKFCIMLITRDILYHNLQSMSKLILKKEKCLSSMLPIYSFYSRCIYLLISCPREWTLSSTYTVTSGLISPRDRVTMTPTTFAPSESSCWSLMAHIHGLFSSFLAHLLLL